MFSKENKEILIKRAKSFVWRLGAMIVVAVLGFVSQNLGMTGLSTEMTVTVGLILGEITKQLNNMYNLEGIVKSTKN